MMKVFSFILTAYLVFLIAVPCCETDNCADELTGNEQSANHESDNNNDCGNCSPFFTCTGCAGFSTSITHLDFEAFDLFASIHFARYVLSSITDVHYDFWQPPRLA